MIKKPILKEGLQEIEQEGAGAVNGLRLSILWPTKRVICLGFLLWGMGLIPIAYADNLQGNACTAPATAGISGSSTGSSMTQPAAGNNLICESGTWQYPTYMLGDDTTSTDTATSCSQAGELRYNTTLSYLQFCNGSNWATVSNSSATTAGCGQSGSFSSASLQILKVAVGCTIKFKVWGAGGAKSDTGCGTSGAGGGGGYATITLGPLGSTTTYYLSIGGEGIYGGYQTAQNPAGGADLTNYKGGKRRKCLW